MFSEKVLNDDVHERKTRSIDENWHNTYHNLDEVSTREERDFVIHLR